MSTSRQPPLLLLAGFQPGACYSAPGSFFLAMRSKRTAQVKAHITPELREQLELFVAQEGSVVSMSDYLFSVLEEHAALRSIRINRQVVSRRTGTQ